MLKVLQLIFAFISAICFTAYLCITFPYFHFNKRKWVKVALMIAMIISEFFLCVTSVNNLIGLSGHCTALFLLMYIMSREC